MIMACMPRLSRRDGRYLGKTMQRVLQRTYYKWQQPLCSVTQSLHSRSASGITAFMAQRDQPARPSQNFQWIGSLWLAQRVVPGKLNLWRSHFTDDREAEHDLQYTALLMNYACQPSLTLFSQVIFSITPTSPSLSTQAQQHKLSW